MTVCTGSKVVRSNAEHDENPKDSQEEKVDETPIFDFLPEVTPEVYYESYEG